MRRRLLLCLPLLAALLAATPAPPAHALDAAGSAAAQLIADATVVRRDGGHNGLLKALRHLRDPALRPLFERLADADRGALQIHGILGLAELSPDRRLDLQRLATVADPAVQAEVTTAALDSGLLSVDAARQVMGWAGTDEGVKVLVAAWLLRQGASDDAGVLRRAAESDVPGRRALAGLLLLQMGDPAGAETLAAVDAASVGNHDVVRALLTTAARDGLNRAGGWAYGIAADPKTEPQLAVLALRTAMRLGEPRASRLWQQKFESAADLVEQVRLGLLALRLSPWLDPALFTPMARASDPMVRQMGLAGAAIAQKDPQLAGQVVPLLLMHHPLVNEWALDYAREVARPEDAQLLLLGVIKAYEQGPEKSRVQRLDQLIEAARLLAEDHPTVAAALLGPMLASPDTPPLMKQGLLVGLLRSEGDAAAIARSLPTFVEADTASLALLLKARHGVRLTAAEVAELGLLARGGGKLQATLRVQAGWLYLKQTGQAQAAVEQATRR